MPYPKARVEVNNRGAVVTGKVSPVMARTMRSWLTGVLKRIRDDARAFSPSDLGGYRKSIIYRTHIKRQVEITGEVYTTEPNQAKAAVIEFGRTPGRKMPPRGALLGWMRRHGIPDDAEFLVRRKIARDGIPGKFPFRKAFVKNRGLLASQSRFLAAALVRDLNRS